MTRHYYFYLLLLLCITACQTDDTTPDINIDISDELRIELWEVLDASERMLELRVATLEDLDCENYSISYTLDQPGSSSLISINNILPPHECIPGIAPASNQIHLNHLSEGEHYIELNLKNDEIVNVGYLKVKPRYYELEMESDHGIYLPWTILKTVPDELIWGYLTIENSADQNAIFDEFKDRIAPWTQTIGLSQGEYGYFEIESGSATAIKDQQETITENIFLFKQIGTRAELQQVLNDMRAEFSNQVSFRIFLSDGSFL